MSGYTLELVRVTDHGKVKHIACDEEMAQNILDSAAVSTRTNPPEAQFDAEYAGEVEVYVPDWMARHIRSGEE